MRDYGKVAPKFWSGETCKELRRRGSEGPLVALYLMTSPGSNMLGLYYQPILFMAHETGLGLEGACKGLRDCIEAGFCEYDEQTEMVWVPTMAEYQIAKELKASDNRCSGIQKDYDSLPNCKFLDAFFDTYAGPFHLKIKRDFKGGGIAPPKPLRSQEQEQEQEQEKEQEQKRASSLRSDSSSPSADDAPAEQPAVVDLTLTPPVDLGEHKAERLRQVTDDAIAAFNAKLGKPHGLLPSVHASVGREKRQAQVKRCTRVARQICEQQFGAKTITREFWDAYWAEVDGDPFRSGRQTPGKGHENWTPSFEYLTREEVMLAVFDRAMSAQAGAA